MKMSNRIEEYRVGNYVVCPKLGSLGKVISITATAFPPGGTLSVNVWNQFSGDHIKQISINYIRPIPLTEDLLEYALSDVFRRAEPDYKYSPTEYEIPREVLPGIWGTANWSLVEDEEEQGKWWLSAGTGSLLTVVRNLHHLQNLFCDLEGEEMTVDKGQVDRILKEQERDGRE